MAQERAAIDAVITRIREVGENPADFYLASIEERAGGQLALPLWYKTDLSGPPAIGSPSGKSRTVIYDVNKRKIVQELGWQ
jgi:hypothetical protein